MRYRFRANPPNTDVVLDRATEGYSADEPVNAWIQLASRLKDDNDTRTITKMVEHLQTRYTIEEMGP